MMRISPFFLTVVCFLLSGCLPQSDDEAKRERMEIASQIKSGDAIVIGVPWKDSKSDYFLEGAKLAVKEINQKGGVLHSNPLKLMISQETDYYAENFTENERRDVVMDVARSFAADPHLIAVVGHSSSNIASIVSTTYQNNGILFFMPNARYSKLTGHNFEYVFRTAFSNLESGIQLADFVAQKGYKNIAVLHNRENSSTELVDTFIAHAVEEHNVNIVFRRSFFDNSNNITPIIVDLKKLQNVDAILISASASMSAKIYQQSRSAGIKLPFLGSEALDTRVFSDKIKQWEQSPAIQKSNIPTFFKRSSPLGKKFTDSFNREYGKETHPDYLAAAGYDTIVLLAHAIQLAQSAVPSEIATSLRYMAPCQGVSGKYEFKPSGDLKRRPLFFKHWEDGNYIYEQVEENTVQDVLEVCNEIDQDFDSVPNSIDACSNTTDEEKSVGVITEGPKAGCPVDKDEDKILDYRDNCPNSTEKEISEGINGWGCVSHKNADN
jgi:branched-chain amino acid transport system substrate-binding protein